MQVKVTVSVGSRTVPLDQVSDSRIRRPIEDLARQVGTTLDRVKCPEHGKTATNVRIHVTAQGSPDLAYDSCCAALGKAIGKALG